MIARLGDILIDEGILSDAELSEGMHDKPRHIMLGDWLIQRGQITRPQLGQALSRQFEVPYEEIDVSAINPQVIRLLPEKLARGSENPTAGHRSSLVAFGHVGSRRYRDHCRSRIDDGLLG